MNKSQRSLYPNYSYIMATITLILSFYSIFSLFLSLSFLWVIVGISFCSSFTCYTRGAKFVHSFLISYSNSTIFADFLLLINSIILFISSFLGLIDFLYLFNLSSLSSLYVPIGIFVILLFAASLGLHQPIRAK